MDPFGLVVVDDQIFLSKVVKSGLEQGIFTRDRADEIIRVSVAMANKYVVHKEVDFRSTEELGKVQETILKLIGVGLEIKSKGDAEQGLRLLMEDSPVDLFRLAHTRVEKLRNRWQLLLQDHRIAIYCSPQEYDNLDDLTCQRLAQMSIFSEQELSTIQSTTLDDVLFSTRAVVEYYESELERYEFILRLKEILPFDLLNKAIAVRASNIAEVDSIREALVNTLLISGFTGTVDPVAVTMADVRQFLQALDLTDTTEVFPEEIENALIDLIHELGEGLNEAEAALLTKEMIRIAQHLMDIIVQEWDTVTSANTSIFFKRWLRLVMLADAPDPIGRILSSDQPLDEFDLAVLVEHMSNLPEQEIQKIAGELPWAHVSPDQIIRLFEELRQSQTLLAPHASLLGFNAEQLADLMEALSPEALRKLLPGLKRAVADARFSLEDLELLASLPHKEISSLLRVVRLPEEYTPSHVVAEFRDASTTVRLIFLYACLKEEWFPELVQEALVVSPEYLQRFVKNLPAAEVGPFLEAAARGEKHRVVARAGEVSVQFDSKGLNGLFKSLPTGKKKAALKYFAEPH